MSGPGALSLRRATADDAQRLFVWANDPHTRAMSIQTAPIPWQGHLAWLERRLEDPDCRLYVAERAAAAGASEAVGQARLDRQPEGALISVSLAPSARGQRLATPLIRLATAEAGAWGCSTVLALIRPDNVASRRAFTAAGFAPDGEAAQPTELLRFVWEAGR